MAGAGFRTFVAGEVLTAAQVNTYLMEQAVMTFADSTARDAALTSPSEGMTVYLKDTDDILTYDGTTWQSVSKQQTVIFTSSGTFTKASYPWAKYATIYCVGPGGAGGGAEGGSNPTDASVGSGGGAGGVSIKYATTASLAASETVTVGTGGAGVSNADGNAGSGNTSFGTICVAGYGNGGQKIGLSTESGFTDDGGTYSGGSDVGDVILGGLQGEGCWWFEVTTVAGTRCAIQAGRGASTIFGAGGRGKNHPNGSAAGAGAAGQGYGAGGGGAYALFTGSGNQTGGDGADGVVIVELSS